MPFRALFKASSLWCGGLRNSLPWQRSATTTDHDDGNGKTDTCMSKAARFYRADENILSFSGCDPGLTVYSGVSESDPHSGVAQRSNP